MTGQRKPPEKEHDADKKTRSMGEDRVDTCRSSVVRFYRGIGHFRISEGRLLFGMMQLNHFFATALNSSLKSFP